MAKKVKEYPYVSGTWTQAKFNAFVKSALRSASQRWPPKYEKLKEAFRGVQTNKDSGRLAKHYECSACHQLYPSTRVEVNHRIPVVPVIGFDNWDGVIKRLFCEKEDLEVVCKPCHKEISKQENKERKENTNG